MQRVTPAERGLVYSVRLRAVLEQQLLLLSVCLDYVHASVGSIALCVALEVDLPDASPRPVFNQWYLCMVYLLARKRLTRARFCVCTRRTKFHLGVLDMLPSVPLGRPCGCRGPEACFGRDCRVLVFNHVSPAGIFDHCS